jgi:hypothetical protein
LECIKDKLSNEEINKQFDERLKEVVGRVPPCPSCAELSAKLAGVEKMRDEHMDRWREDATALCRVRGATQIAHEIPANKYFAVLNALDETGPCRHEGEAKRLRGELNRVEHLYRNRESLTMSDFAALVEDIFLHRRKAGREG